MKKNISKMLSLILGMLIICSVMACSESDILDNEVVVNPTGEEHTCEMIFQSKVPSFGQPDGRRAASGSWADKSKVYLQLASGDEVVRGTATYSDATSSWTVVYTGSLKQGASTCEAYYFDGVEETNIGFKFTESTAVYQDLSAQYSFDGTKLVVGATLKPRTGRVKFKGTGERLFVQGLTRFTGYNQGSNSFTTSEEPILLNLKDGETDYIYVTFTDTKIRKLRLSDMKTVYEKSFPEAVLAVGESGYMDVPTEEEAQGWANINPFALAHIPDSIDSSRQEIISDWLDEMVRVESTKDFNFSSTYPTIVSPFYINKYEVTQRVYRAVMNKDFVGYKQSLGDLLPIYSYSVNGDGTTSSYYNYDIPMGAYSEGFIDMPYSGYGTYIAQVFRDFIAKLNLITGLNFDYPTEAEWEYAARGGQNYTVDYTYAGSNAISEVAFTSESDDFDVQKIGSKKANPLGLYDMTGNVSEICYYIGDDLKTSPNININPKVYEGLYCWRGGNNYDMYYSYSSYDSSKYSRVDNRLNHSNNSFLYRYYYGLRLVLRMME